MIAAVRFAFRLSSLLLLTLAVAARAHDPGISTAQGAVKPDVFEIVTGLAPLDAEQMLPESVRTGQRWGQAEFDAVKDRLQAIAPELWEVRAGETRLVPREAKVDLLPGDNVSFHLVFPRPPAVDLTLSAPKIPLLPPGHRQFVVVANDQGKLLTKKLLSAKDHTIEVRLSAPPPATAPGGASGATGAAAKAPTAEPEGEVPTFWGFVRLGVEHIWTGYDHLLFLFALLVVCRTFRSIVTIITYFTIAHSITLALATLEVVNLPARLVEPLIAASIVFVGVENLLRRGEEPKGRWALTFAFGLIHGFGFASVLRDLGVGKGGSGIAMPLFTFNLGVELGQVAVAGVVLPLVWWARKNERFVRVGVPALSAVVAAAGVYWLLERTLFA